MISVGLYLVNSWNGINSCATSDVQLQCLSSLTSKYLSLLFSVRCNRVGYDVGPTMTVTFCGRFESAGR